ncbi:MAG: glycosyltransferase family 2 protein [Acidimicrobiia bacterium]
MHNNKEVAVVIPCYNEELLIRETVSAIPDFIDHIICVNDASTDNTANVLEEIANTNSKVKIVTNDKNLGVGGALINGYKYAIDKTNSTAIGIVAGDAQFDSSYLIPMIDLLETGGYDYVKANRFFHREAFKKMPKYRQIGNIVVSILTKFSTGYYSISDITNGCGFLTRKVLERVNYDFVQERYDYETSMLTALSIAGAKIKDFPVPAKYGDEKSTIKLLPTVMRNLKAIWVGFWRRLYYKYILFGFHPIALFALSGMLLTSFGIAYGAYISFQHYIYGHTPSSATVMISVLPIILGFQLLLTSISMDMNYEGKS